MFLNIHINRYSALLLFLLLPLAALSQRPAYGKMSSLVREACNVAKYQNSGNAAKSQKVGNEASTSRWSNQPLITAFVKTSQPFDLSAEGCKVLAQYGNLYVVSMPISKISNLSLRPEVLRIEAERRAKAMMDTTNIIIGSSVLHEGINLPKTYTGSGVVVGVQDIGFDLTHPTFYSRDMKHYRIKAMWDQLSTDTLGSRLPAGRDYRDSVSLLTIGHPLDGLIQTHGTHTAGIAAGSGSEGVAFPVHEVEGQGSFISSFDGAGGRFCGVAPSADICLVCNATGDDASLISEGQTYKYTYALDALGFKYIFDYADSVGKPCVINFSEGSYEDFRGDDVLYYEMLDSLVGPGHIIVSAAGNEGGQINYCHKPIGETMAEIGVSAPWHQKTMSFTTLSSDDFTLRLVNGSMVKDIALQEILQTADSTLNDSIVLDGINYKVTATAYNDCYDAGRIATDWLISSDNFISHSFTLQLNGSDADIELYRGSATFSNPTESSMFNKKSSKFKVQSSMLADNSHSVLSPGSAPNVICVGMTGYRTKYVNYLGKVMDFGGSTGGAIQPNSSIGPTYDGRIKPDVVAPGQNIVSSYSSFYIEHNPDANDINSDVRHFQYNGRTYAWNSNMGTSMSSPVVAGVIALWLEANPRLTPQDILDVFSKTCTHYDESLTYPNNVYGYGQIDAEAGLRLILEKTGIKSVSVEREKDNKIFTIDGRYVGNDSQKLPQGIYIKNNKKILIR